ncbi:MAG: hypothetical protein LBV60_12930 [Streptomyces sp.]|nr:hypothetical protein [Streptomyces sp.]
MISQILTLVGVLVGALSSYLVTTAAERARHRRMMDMRWDERKLAAYVEYAAVVKETHRLARAAFEARRTPEAATLLAAMDEAEGRRSILFETLVLLAEPAAVAAANALNERLWDSLVLARGGNGEDGDWAPVGREVVMALGDLHALARVDLGVAGDLRPGAPVAVGAGGGGRVGWVRGGSASSTRSG